MRASAIASVAGATVVLLGVVTGAAFAEKKPNPGGHAPAHAAPSHPAPHVNAAPRVVPHISAAPNVTRHFTPHIAHVTPHVTPHARITHFARPVGRPSHTPRAGTLAHVTHHGRGSHRIAHQNTPNGVHNRTRNNAVTNNAVNNHHARVDHNALTNHNALTTHTAALPAARIRGRTDPRRFVAHRRFAADPAFRPFLDARWHRHHHLGWLGPLFWPYAYGDVFYDALWPYDYENYDPFWAYGYADIYEGIFSPYDYDEYVQGPAAPARMARLTQSVAQSCSNEAAEVTGWPIDQIQAAVAPNAQQNALLDDLGNAIVQASDVIKSHCPTAVAFTPTDRLAQMQERLEGMVQAVNVVQPALARFYDSLSDEQKARFNDIGSPSAKQAQNRQPQNPQSTCGENAVAWPAERIEQDLHLSDEQRARLDALNKAAAAGADTIKAACPSELPATPPGRLAAEGKRLQAILQAVEAIRPKLDAFYASLSDDQKARFNTIGRQVFAER